MAADKELIGLWKMINGLTTTEMAVEISKHEGDPADEHDVNCWRRLMEYRVHNHNDVPLSYFMREWRRMRKAKRQVRPGAPPVRPGTTGRRWHDGR